LQRFFIIAGFALFFIAVQLVTLYGCYNIFCSFKNKKTRIAALAYILFLNLSCQFLFYRYPLPAELKTAIKQEKGATPFVEAFTAFPAYDPSPCHDNHTS